MMNDLLDRQTGILIPIVQDGVVVEPDAIYLIPPRKEMIISDGRLPLTDKAPRDGLSLPIDQFFRSLAADMDSRSVGIILSGRDRMSFFGRKSAENVVRVYVEHYHSERNHQGLGNDLIEPVKSVGAIAGKV